MTIHTTHARARDCSGPASARHFDFAAVTPEAIGAGVISLTMASWTRHFFYRAERTRTTWKFRIGLLAVLLLVFLLSRGWLPTAVAQSLICDSSVAPSDAILVENFDPSYLPFETAARLRRAGVAPRVLVPVAKNGSDEDTNLVSLRVTELMASLARLGPIDIVPIGEVEPISLNAARDVLQFMQREGLRSVVVVSPLFRSRRSALIYDATLGPAGIAVRCQPSSDIRDPNAWASSLHGMQNVAEQWLKLQYYKLYVLPFKA
jgi:hypothetical protein